MKPFLFSHIGLLVIFLACGTGGQKGSFQDQLPATLKVENHSYLDMTIYVLRGSQRFRLGIAPSATTKVFEIPEFLLFGPTTLRFLADPIGSTQTPVSQDIDVKPGDEVVLIIPY